MDDSELPREFIDYHSWVFGVIPYGPATLPLDRRHAVFSTWSVLPTSLLSQTLTPARNTGFFKLNTSKAV
jgi:hypothetical protein